MAQRTQADRTAATTAALLAAGRQLFGDQGFGATSTTELASHAGVTRGALYHHYEDKRGLFRAVYTRVAQEVVTQVWEAALAESRDTPAATARAHLHAGAAAFLGACTAPDVRRIMLLDAPAALGWETWRELEAEHALATIELALERAIQAGAIRPLPLTALAPVVLGALTESALQIAHADDTDAARAQALTTIDALLEGLAA